MQNKEPDRERLPGRQELRSLRFDLRGPTPRQALFVRVLLSPLVQGGDLKIPTFTRAAELAGYSAKNSQKTGSRLMRHPAVREEIKRYAEAYGMEHTFVEALLQR